MAVLVITSNAGTTTNILIPDMGIEVPSGGGSVTLEDLDALFEAAQSNDLVALAQDDAFGAGSSTLFLSDGINVVVQDFSDEFLDTIFLTRIGPYSAVLRDENGNLVGFGGITETEHEELDTLVHQIAEDSFTEVTYDVFARVTDIIIWSTPAKLLKIRETNVTYIGLSRRVLTHTEIQYDAAGVELARVETTYTYTGFRLLSGTTVRTP